MGKLPDPITGKQHIIAIIPFVPLTVNVYDDSETPKVPPDIIFFLMLASILSRFI